MQGISPAEYIIASRGRMQLLPAPARGPLSQYVKELYQFGSEALSSTALRYLLSAF